MSLERTIIQSLKLTNELVMSEVTTDSSRIYSTPTGDYHSVTTILSATKTQEKEEKLQAWRDRVGEEEADQVVRRAIRRGNELHHNIEKYLEGQETNFKNPIVAGIFKKLKPTLDEIDPYVCEIPLYSPTLRIAGRSDCLGLYKGERTVIDFKNSAHPKMEAWIEDYFIQGYIYSHLIEEHTGYHFSKMLILIGNAYGPPSIVLKDTTEFKSMALERINQFYATLG